MVLLITVFMFTYSCLPSDGFDLTDKVQRFAISCVRQQHTEKCSHYTEKCSHYANCGENNKWQTLHAKQAKCASFRQARNVGSLLSK